MSDDSSPSSPARDRDPLLARSNDDDASAAAVAGDAPDQTDGPSSPRRNGQRGHRRGKKKKKRRKNPGLASKLTFVTHLLKTLDLVVFAELSALYYMECSIFRFALRSIPQFMYLTPKDETWPFLMPATRLHVILILIPNIACMLLHLLGSLPQGPDHHRGYQHGGIIIDFVGQKPPAWRVYYLMADLAILYIQCLMLSIHTEREKLRVVLKTFRPLFPDVAQEVATARTLQDLDAEEQGVLRDSVATVAVDETDAMEMRPLQWRPRNPERLGEVGDEAEGSRRRSQTHLLNIMRSGNAIIGEYNVARSIKTATFDFERTAAHSLRTIGYEATMALHAQQQAQRQAQRRAGAG